MGNRYTAVQEGEIHLPVSVALKRIHLIGIGGVGMAGLAVLLKDLGARVDGCDKYASPRTHWLESRGIPVAIGHSPDHVKDVDYTIITPAVHPDNPEFCAARNRLYRGDVLAWISSQRETIAVCGSHGKTTTATFTAKLLRLLGEAPAWAIGGETGDFPVAGTGSGPLVVEADESDGTLAHYRAAILVVTNCEYDHPDHFKTRADYEACFNAARERAKEVIEVGTLFPLPDLPQFAALAPHNRLNARAAMEVALRRGHPLEKILFALAEVVKELPDRRFQLIAPKVYTDYAHHPTEMACAVGMARKVCAGRLRVLFQPHRYSRTKALLNDFPSAFTGADEVILCPTYAAFEEPILGGDTADLYAACRAKGNATYYLARTCEEAWEHAFLESAPNDITLVLGAGDIINLVPRIKSDCAKGAVFSERTPLRNLSFFKTGGYSVGGGTRHIVGMGSNLWISDLTTHDTYLKASGAMAQPGAALHIAWMVGVPGTIGGWLKMNAGAFGHSISELIRRVKVNGAWLEKSVCGFSYRASTLEGEIEDVEWDEVALNAARKESAADYLARRKKFPPRCCGSVFKNPPNDFAGRLLEVVGVKDLRVGGAFVWHEHANVIAAGEGATSSDILALVRLMYLRVKFLFGVELEPEIRGLSVQ